MSHKILKVLIACEESQRVCSAFRNLGHEAYSCDLQDPSGGHPEWHILDDVLRILNPEEHDSNNARIDFETMDDQGHTIDKWDLIIAFPPCTHLAVSGAAWFKRKRADGRQRVGIEFFCKFFEAECDHIAIENPVGIISGYYIPTYFPDLADKYDLPKKPSQIIQPWQFGDNYNKSTCLWLKDLPPLMPLVTEQPALEWYECPGSKTGKMKRMPKWYADAWGLSPSERAKVRSKTFPGIAQAMADQWSRYLIVKEVEPDV